MTRASRNGCASDAALSEIVFCDNAPIRYLSMGNVMIINTESIKALLLSNDRAVERAIIVIFNRQTSDEQEAGHTSHHNGKGFNAFDAESGTYYARWIQRGNSLTGRHLVRARKMSLRYVRQLVEEAQIKATSSQSTQAA